MNISKVSNYAYSAVVAVPTAIYNKAISLLSRVSSAVASCFSKIASLFSRSTKPLTNVARAAAGSTTPASSVAHSALSTPAATPPVTPAVTPVASRPATPTLSARDEAIASLSTKDKKLFDNLRETFRATLEERQNDFLSRRGKSIQ